MLIDHVALTLYKFSTNSQIRGYEQTSLCQVPPARYQLLLRKSST